MKTLRLTAILLFFAVIFCSCKKNENDVPYDEPAEIPVTEYSFTGTNCSLTRLEQDKLTVITSNKELKNYIICTDSNYPEIDFSKHTLLLANGGVATGIYRIDTKFYRNAANNYTLYVTVYLGISMFPETWRIYVLVPKITDLSVITLDVQLKDC